MTDNPSEDQTFRERVDELLSELLDLEPEERAERLAAIEDERLRARVEEMLEVALDESSPLQVGGAASTGLVTAALDAPDRSGEQLGAYRLGERLGQGGMGVVYRAERVDGRFEREVAVKIGRQGDQEGEDVLFEREQQILAALEHPNIARLYDGGLTELREPYFVMELVRGQPIDRHCADAELDLRDRLELAAQVCSAVEAAHRQLVVHRDLKPSNILVQAEGGVKLLDFGIAKLLGGDTLADTAGAGLSPTLPTPLGTVGALTLQYSSPEQLRGDVVTTASDVYQLGLLLYELLVGERPYTIQSLDREAALELVLAARPAPVSERLSVNKRAARVALSDLDAIVARALATAPEDRYTSAEQLREDLEACLAGYPVRAQGQGTLYRVRRALARHPWRVGLAVSTATILLALSGVFTWRLAVERDATRAEADRADAARREAEAVADFLTELFQTSNPLRSTGPDTTARELLEEGARRLDQELANEPLLRARLLQTVGSIHTSLGLYDRSATLLDQARSLLEENGGGASDLTTVLVSQATLARRQGDLERADLLYGQALDGIDIDLEPERYARALIDLSNLRHEEGQIEESLEMLETSRELLVEDGEGGVAALLDANIAGILTQLGRTDEAIELLEGATSALEEERGADHASVAMAQQALARIHSEQGRADLAVPLYESVISTMRQQYGPNHQTVADLSNNIGNNLIQLERYEEAREHFEGALEFYDRFLPGHPRIAIIAMNLGTVEWYLGRPAEAEIRYREALRLHEERFTEDHPEKAVTLFNLGEAIWAQGRLDEAERTLDESLRQGVATLGADHFFVSFPLFYLARIYAARGENDRAENTFQRVLTLRRETTALSPDDLEEAEEAYREFQENREGG